MSAGPPARRTRFAAVARTLSTFRRETGASLRFWVAFALLHLATQIVFRRYLQPGEFAILNTLLGVIVLMTVPVFALQHAFAYFRPRDADVDQLALLKNARLPLLLPFAVGWAILATLLLFPLLAFLNLPRFSLGLLTVPNVLLALGAYVSASYYERQNRLRFWSWLLLLAAVIRLLLVFVFTRAEPWAEAGLAAGLLAGLVAISVLLRGTDVRLDWKKASAAWRDREFRAYLAATFSVMLGLFLFTNADRIVAQIWFGTPGDNNMGLVKWGLFDGYQTAGLLGRGLLWATQPLLLLLLVRRSRQEHTTHGSRRIFWIYCSALLAGAILLDVFALPLTRLFGGPEANLTTYFIPPFAAAMVPLGLLQGVGIFALASRRYPECFTLGGCSLAYTLLLVLAGRPQVMLSYIFGGGVIALMLVLAVGIVRWGRRQP
jgi:hypothetical protein